MELRARAKRDRTRFHELKSVRKKGGHSRAVPRREAGKHVREEGRNRRSSSEGGQPGLEVGSGQLSRKNTPSPG